MEGRVHSKTEEVAVLSVNQLIWLRFKRSRPAVYSGIFLIVLYLVAAFAGFLAPYGKGKRTSYMRLLLPTAFGFLTRLADSMYDPLCSG